MSAQRFADAPRFDEDAMPWRPWTPREAADRLAAVRPGGRPLRWAVAGGWAVELFLREHGTDRHREHEDVEIEVAHDDVRAVLEAFAVPDWEWCVPTPEGLWPLGSARFAQEHQTWLWSEPDGCFRLDVFRVPHGRDRWVYRREPGLLSRPWADAVRRASDGIPYLAPAIPLLFKAKPADQMRPKDEADFAAALPLLDDGERTWLRDALAAVAPDHPWRQQV